MVLPPALLVWAWVSAAVRQESSQGRKDCISWFVSYAIQSLTP